jgi:hypothetical protein
MNESVSVKKRSGGIKNVTTTTTTVVVVVVGKIRSIRRVVVEGIAVGVEVDLPRESDGID